MNYDDPFTFLFDELWNALERNQEFCDLVKATNRIKLKDGFRPFKETITESSIPEVVLMPAGKEFFVENPCNGSSIIQTVHATITTGTRNTSKLFPVQWRVAQAIYTAINRSSGHLFSLTWNDEAIIKDIDMLPLEEGLSYDELNRELRGWAAILPLRVKMFFTTNLLLVE